MWLGYDDNRETGLIGAAGALRVWADVITALDIQPRQTSAPADIAWDTLPQRAVRDPLRRDCSETLSLPFRADRLPEVDWSCEVNDSFFERLIDRIRQ